MTLLVEILLDEHLMKPTTHREGDKPMDRLSELESPQKVIWDVPKINFLGQKLPKKTEKIWERRFTSNIMETKKEKENKNVYRS